MRDSPAVKAWRREWRKRNREVENARKRRNYWRRKLGIPKVETSPFYKVKHD